MSADVKVEFACGRQYLAVNGFVVAVEGDVCRDSALPGTHWNRELLETVASGKPRKTGNPENPFASLPAVNAEAEYRAQKLRNREEDAWAAEHLKETFAVVEATSNEQHTLWADWAVENTFRVRDPRDQRQFVFWEQISRGFAETVGAFCCGKEVMPVAMTIFWARLRLRPVDEGRLVMFWEMCSQVTDARMAEKFISENVAKKVISTDAANFHNVVHALEPDR